MRKPSQDYGTADFWTWLHT